MEAEPGRRAARGAGAAPRLGPGADTHSWPIGATSKDLVVVARGEDESRASGNVSRARDSNEKSAPNKVDQVTAPTSSYTKGEHLNGRQQLANEIKDKLADRQAHRTSDTGGGGQTTGRRGLLEALIGERARSWRDQKAVVVEIQNGQAKRENKNQQQQQRKGDQVDQSTKSGQTDETRGHAETQVGNRSRPVASGGAQKKETNRLPTFGSIPQKLTQLPYFSYQGRAKNVELTSAADRAQLGALASRYRQLGRSDGSAASLSGSSRASSQVGASSYSSASPKSSGASSSSAGSKIPTLTRTSKFAHVDGQQGQRDQRDASEDRRSSQATTRRQGYSNISNLFVDGRARELHPNRKQEPGEPGGEAARRQEAADRKLLSSLLMTRRNRSFVRQTPASANRPLDARNRSLQSLDAATTGGASRYQTVAMRRQNGGPGAPGHQAQQRAGAGQQQQPLARARPASAAGNYMAPGQHQRSPSTGSLHHYYQSRRAAGAPLSPYAAQPVDPDCPVHSDRQLASGPAEPEVGAYKYERTRSRPEHASSQPSLLYDEQQHFPAYFRAHNYYERPAYKSPPLYSPASPADRQPASARHRTSQSNGNLSAYYNSASKFSLYHQSGELGTGIRSSLAPAGEQLRRILGYRPAHSKPVHLHPQWAYSRPFIHLQPARSPSPLGAANADDELDMIDDIDGPRFAPFNQLLDTQAIRAIDFHPSGEVYAVGSNSRALRICAYPAEHELRHFNPLEATASNTQPVKPPRVLFKFLQVHRGSIYCVAFNQAGQLLATGSNDQTVHIVRYNSHTHNPDGEEFRLTMHNGTVRDLCFIDDITNGSSLLLSAGGGDNKIYVTDCDTITPFQSMQGHTHMVMALHHVAGAQFVSASYDKTIRFWDLRSRTCTSIISAPVAGASTLGGPGAPVCSLRADPSGRLLASGHTDSTCMLYDIRGGKTIQTFRPHDDEIRAISFSPKSYYLLTGAYDGRLVVSDLQGDLTQPLPSVCVAESQDKIVQAKWHPSDFTFVSTSADKTATLWALPGDF